MVVARATDVGMDDRLVWRRRCGVGLVEPVVEDRPDRAIGSRADVERTAAGCLDPLAAEAPDQADDAEAARKPCSGWGRSVRTFSHSKAVQAPIAAASRAMRSIVQSAKRRCEDGMCSTIVVWRPLPLLRIWAAMRSPLWKSSIVRAVILASTGSRAKR